VAPGLPDRLLLLLLLHPTHALRHQWPLPDLLLLLLLLLQGLTQAAPFPPHCHLQHHSSHHWHQQPPSVLLLLLKEGLIPSPPALLASQQQYQLPVVLQTLVLPQAPGLPLCRSPPPNCQYQSQG
jgi:hypothetical protein